MLAQRLAQRGDQLPLDHVEEDAGVGVLTVEELLNAPTIVVPSAIQPLYRP
jgi:hypothetical protein